MRAIRLPVLAFLCLMVLISGVRAQDTNLLGNPSLEEGSAGAYTQKRGGDKPIYAPTGGWNIWLPGTPRGDYYDRSEKVTVNPHPETGWPKPLKGLRALVIDCGFVTCTAAVYQTVSTGITPGTKVRGSAWATLKACNARDSKGNFNGICESAIESGAKTRVGIDPNGGTDPNDADIVWSNFISPHMQGGWQSMSVDATATGNSVTLFLYSTQQNFADINMTYWDEASLSVGGGGGAVAAAATPVPTPIPVAAFVVPQAPQGDGAITHVVQGGDTVDAIAFAYGVTRQQILDLNNLASPRLISPGQKLIIKTAEPKAPEPTTEPAVEPTTDTAPASEPTSDTSAVEPTSEQVEPTQPPEPTAAPVEPTTAPVEPTNAPPAPVTQVAANNVNPAATTGSVCVMLFEDTNQNRIQETGENALPGGTVVVSQAGQPVGSYQTENVPDPHCFPDLSIGDYVAVASAPNGYGLTTSNQLRVQLSPGATINLTFGAAQGVQPVAPPPADAGGALVSETQEQQPETVSLTDRLLSVSGYIIFGLAAVVLIGGIGLALVLRRR